MSTEPWTITLDRGPSPVEFTITNAVATAEPQHAVMRIEAESDDAAYCSFKWETDTPVKITVHKPHDRSLIDEATETLAALYWSRWRGAGVESQ
jgi:hypothetical protein